MEQNSNEPIMSSDICPVCHQPILPSYYFCPNCGTKLNVNIAPLSTTTGTQIWIYIYSIILPMICFITVKKWPGIKYFKSKEPKAKRIGQIAWALIILSTIVTIWLATIFTQMAVKSTTEKMNADLSELGL